MRENNFYHRGRSRGGGGYRGRNKPYERPKFMENRKDENGQVTKCNFCSSTYRYANGCEKKKAEEFHLTESVEEIDFALAAQHET